MRLSVAIGIVAIGLAVTGCGEVVEPQRISDSGSSEGSCHPDYSGCLPDDGYDLDCAEVGRPVRVSGGDEYGLDRDGDGMGCEASG